MVFMLLAVYSITVGVEGIGASFDGCVICSRSCPGVEDMGVNLVFNTMYRRGNRG